MKDLGAKTLITVRDVSEKKEKEKLDIHTNQ
jgi:hypothetical protein